VLVTPARADEVDDLVANGEAFAKDGVWTRAIDAFKAADAKRPRAKHACLIALAYTRREAWAEAELFLSICRQRATADDPLPAWIDEAEGQLHDKLALAGAAPVTIDVDPRDARSVVAVSSFAADETFSPRTIHLSPGTYTITASAPGYIGARQTIAIADARPQAVTLRLERPPPSRTPWLVIAGGAAVVVAGVAFDVGVLQPDRTALAKQTTRFEYDAHVGDARAAQIGTIAIVTVGAAAIATGVVLRYKARRRIERAPRVGVAIGGGRALVAVEWSR